MRQTVNRKRWPQIGAFAIVALPPDDEMTLDESLELLQRIVAHIIGTNALVAIVAVHDPRRTTPGARNRHAHVIVPLREVDRHGLGKKVRNLVARPRRNSKARRNYMAEGTHWPGLAYEMLQSFLAELGTDDVVDPPALVGERHWPPSVVRNDPERIERIGVPRRKHFKDILSDPKFNVFYDAPVLIVIANKTEGPWATIDCALAAQNLMLAARAAGLGTCWIGFAQSFLADAGRQGADQPAARLPAGGADHRRPSGLISVPRPAQSRRDPLGRSLTPQRRTNI